MDWETFKNIPDHAQEEYLLYLQHQFGATATDISKMLGITAGTLRKYIGGKNFKTSFSRGHRMSPDSKSRWEQFLSDNAVETVLEDEGCDTDESESSPETKDKPVENIKKSAVMAMSEVTLKFEGSVDINGVTNTLKAVLGNNIDGTIYICYSGRKGESI